MYPGFLSVGCSEVLNSERAAVYSQGAAGEEFQCDRCPGLPQALGHDPYTTPQADDAPWYDPLRFESLDFFGVSGGAVEGLSSTTFTRTPVSLVSGGAAIGPLRRGAREIAYTATMWARSECGLSYGMEWLARSLSGDPCEGLCAGVEAQLFACCPDDADASVNGSLRTLYNVGVLEGPTVTDRQWIVEEELLAATVTFTLVAGNPWIFGEPLDTGDDWISLADGTPVRRDPDAVYQKCLPPTPCADDELCPSPRLPPAPPAPLSPCYARGAANFLVSRIQVTSEEYPLWAEMVPVVEVIAGGEDLRRLLVRFWFNPANGSCLDELDPCDSCGDVNVSFVPAGSTLTIDGRTQRSVIECETEDVGIARSAPDLYGIKGGMFTYPYFPCAGGLCVEVWARQDTVAADSQVRVQLVPRADAM